MTEYYHYWLQEPGEKYAKKVVEERYVNLLSDLGFKHVFGRQANKDIIIAFLNGIIPDRKIADIEHLRNEQIPVNKGWKKSIYDLYCSTDDGSRIIVELQQEPQADYVDRALYYATFPIQSQVERGNGEYTFCPVYVISIVNFCLSQLQKERAVLSNFKFRDEKGNLLSEKISLIFIELPKFTKSLEQLDQENVMECFYFCLKHINSLSEKPAKLQNKIMERLFEVAEIAAMTPEEQQQYMQAMKTERDIRNYISFARNKGKEEGIAEGRKRGLLEGRQSGLEEGIERGLTKCKHSVALAMKNDGMPNDLIAKYTGLTIQEIEKL